MYLRRIKTRKEKDEALFFDYEEVIAKKVKYVLEKKPKEEKEKKKFFHHNFANTEEALKRIYNSQFYKAVVVKNLSSLDVKGTKNALAYVLRNSNDNFAINENGDKVNLDELMKDWNKTFKHNRLNSKESLHLIFSVNEEKNEDIEKILKSSVFSTMSKNFFDYKWAMIYHSHQNNPHIHVVLNKNNIFTNKKLHLNNKEFKELFSTLRTDFALALNERGLKYANKSVLEKYLEGQIRDLENKDFYDYRSKKDLNLELAKMYANTEEKIEIKKEKISILLNELENLYAIKNNELLQELTRLKNLDGKHKKAFKILKELKKINLQIKDKKRKTQTLFKEIKALKDFGIKIEEQRYKYKNLDKISMQTWQKKKIIDFIKENTKSSNINLSLSQKIIIQEIEKELEIKNTKLSERIIENAKASLIVSSVLNKKNTSYDLINSYKELDKNLKVLNESIFANIYLAKDDKMMFDFLLNRVKNNKDSISKLLENRLTLLEKDFKENIISLYKVKEYERASKFLSKDNEEYIKELYKKVENKIEKNITNLDDTNASAGAKEKENETKNNKENLKNLSNDKTNTQNTENKNLNQEQSKNNLNKTDKTSTQKADKKEKISNEKTSKEFSNKNTQDKLKNSGFKYSRNIF